MCVFRYSKASILNDLVFRSKLNKCFGGVKTGDKKSELSAMLQPAGASMYTCVVAFRG